MNVIKQALILSCLVGDVDTVSRILEVNTDLDLNEGWERAYSLVAMTPLVAAAWNHDNRIANMLLRSGAGVGPTQQDGVRKIPAPAPIHVAAYYRNVNLVQKLIDGGADCKVRYLKSGYKDTYSDSYLRRNVCSSTPWLLPTRCSSPLQFALERHDNVPVAELLLPYSKLHGGELVRAKSTNNGAVVPAILSKIKSTFPINGYSEAVLRDIIEAGDIEATRAYFLSGGPYTSSALSFAIESALDSLDYSLVRLLTESRPRGKLDRRESMALICAIERCNWDLVYLMLDEPLLPASGIPRTWYHDFICPRDLDLSLEPLEDLPYIRERERGNPGDEACSCWPNDYNTPLSAALRSQNMNLVEFMLQRGFVLHPIDLWIFDEDNVVPDCAALEKIRAAIFSKFPLTGLELTCRQVLLSRAIRSGDAERARQYLDLVDSLEFVALSHRSHIPFGPLAAAAAQGNLELVHILLGKVTNIDYAPPRGLTPLQAAVLRGHTGIVKLLMDRGALVDPPNQLAGLPRLLNMAVREANLPMARLLIEQGVNINAQPMPGDYHTALQTAALNGKVDMVGLLLEMGAKITGEMRIYYVWSVALAASQHHYALAGYIRQYGSWNDTDERLYKCIYRNGTFVDSHARFHYDKEQDQWHIRLWRRKQQTVEPLENASYYMTGYDWHSLALSSDISAHSDFPADYDDDGIVASRPYAWYGYGFDDDDDDDDDDTVRSLPFTRSDYSSDDESLESWRVWWEATASTSPDLLRDGIIQGPDNATEEGGVIGQITAVSSSETNYRGPAMTRGHDFTRTSTTDNVGADQTYGGSERMVTEQQMPDCDMQDVIITSMENASPTSTDVDRDAFGGTHRFHELNRLLQEVSMQDILHFDSSGIDIEGWRNMVMNNVESEWEGPFTYMEEPDHVIDEL